MVNEQLFFKFRNGVRSTVFIGENDSAEVAGL